MRGFQIVKFKAGSGEHINDGDAAVVGAELQAIAREGGQPAPRPLLERARPKDSPAHYLFEWRDSVAAEAHRLDQARRLIQAVEVQLRRADGQIRTVRYVVVLSSVGHEEPERDFILHAMSDKDKRARLLADLAAWLESGRQRFEMFEEFADWFDAGRRRLARIAKRKASERKRGAARRGRK